MAQDWQQFGHLSPFFSFNNTGTNKTNIKMNHEKLDEKISFGI